MKHKNNAKFEYSQITKHVFIGTNLCCLTHFNKSLIRKGIKADISLEKERMDQASGAKFYLWLPTKDTFAPDKKQLYAGVAFLHSLVGQNIKCYVHCHRGHGRAPTLVAAYLISLGMKVEEAIGLIKKKRPVIHLNKRQVAALKKFLERKT